LPQAPPRVFLAITNGMECCTVQARNGSSIRCGV
jgi:hypothetical protein